MTKPKPIALHALEVVEIKARQIPAWVTAIPAPTEADLQTVLSDARHTAGWFQEKSLWRPWFIALADALMVRIGDPPYVGTRLSDLLDTLDLVPALLDHGADFLSAEVHGAILRGVREVFTYRHYTAYDELRKRLGKPSSSGDLVMLRLYEHARLRGETHERAIAYVRQEFSHVTDDGVMTALRRAKKGPFA